MLIKPDAVRGGRIGSILDIVIHNGFTIVAMRMVRMQRHVAEQLYRMHRGRPFYDGLIEFMTSGGSVAVVLERHDAINAMRCLAGNTDPAKADCGTLRHLFGSNKMKNAVHASDCEEGVRRESALFFNSSDYVDTSGAYEEQYVH